MPSEQYELSCDYNRLQTFIETSELGTLIDQYRLDAGYSKENIRKQLKLGGWTWDRWCTGSRLIRWENLNRVIELLEIPRHEIVPLWRNASLTMLLSFESGKKGGHHISRTTKWIQPITTQVRKTAIYLAELLDIPAEGFKGCEGARKFEADTGLHRDTLRSWMSYSHKKLPATESRKIIKQVYGLDFFTDTHINQCRQLILTVNFNEE